MHGDVEQKLEEEKRVVWTKMSRHKIWQKTGEWDFDSWLIIEEQHLKNSWIKK